MRIARFLLSGLLLVSVLTAGIGYSGPAASGTAHAADAASQDVFTKDQLDALAYLNKVRAKLGLQPFALNANLNKAAEAHAKYYNLNKNDSSVANDPHGESAGKPGFTGASIYDRMKASGYSFGNKGWAYGEVMHFNQKTSIDAIDGWLDTAYHRKAILETRYREIGIGLVDGTAVIDLGGDGTTNSINGGAAVYPYDGMTGVQVGFYGNERPNPLSRHRVDYSGYIISAITEKTIVWHEAKITDENGAEVPYYEELSLNALYLFPKNILQGFHTYKVTVSYQEEGQDGKRTQSWTFKTGQGHKLIALESKYAEVVVNEGGEQPLQISNYYDDNTRDSLLRVTYASSSPAGLKVSAEGVVKGIKAGHYTVTVKSGTIKLPVAIRVLPKLKTKSYAASNPALMTDISNHKEKTAIEWAMRAGIMTGATKSLFKPNASVSEAEFWTMLLRMYKVNYESYNPAKKIHWADGAYKIAADRNIPLAGLKKKEAKDAPITRVKAAEIIAAADGKNYMGSNAIWYVLGMDYVRGVTESSIEGYQGSTALTRGETAKVLQYVQPKLREILGAPTSIMPGSTLPPLPERVLYVKPDKLKDRSIFVEYGADHTLSVEGMFSKYAGKELKLMIQYPDGSNNSIAIEDVFVKLDSTGKFRAAKLGPYDPAALNLYLVTEEAYFSIQVGANTMSLSTYS